MRRGGSTVLLLAAFGLFAVSGRAHAQFTGQISGRVTDASTGAPLANITIKVVTSDGGWGGLVQTDASGIYTTAGMAEGTYYLRTLNAYPYLDELYSDIPCPGASCWELSGTGVPVKADTTVNGIDLQLTLGGTITGTVTDASTGAPLTNISVRAFTASGEVAGSIVTTNPSGQYSLPGLVTGIYLVRTTNSLPFLDELYREQPCPADSCYATMGTAVSVTAGTATTGVDFTLARSATLTGTVRDARTGAPIAGVSVQAFNASGSPAGSSPPTNGSGVYAVTGLATGTYYLRTSNSFPYLDEVFPDVPCPGGNCSLFSGTGVEVTAGTATSGIDFSLSPGGIITGTVTVAGTGTPLANVPVRAYTAGGSAVGDAVRTDGAGVYAIIGLLTGTFYVRTSIGSPYYDELYNDLPCTDGSCVATGGTGISVTAGQSTGGIDFALGGQGTITGTVTDAATGAPLESVRVEVRAASTGAVVASGWTREAGAYTVNGLAAGPYYVQTSIGHPYRDELYNDVPCPEGSCTVTAGAAVVVNAGATTAGIDFSLLTEGGTITGTVTDARTGAPLNHVFVNIYTANGTLRGETWTNASGVFSVIGLATGTYYLQTSNSYPYFGELYNDRPCPAGSCTVTSGTGVPVVSGTTTSGIDFMLTSGGTVTGTVTDVATGAPLANVSVRVRTAGGVVVASATTNASGAYTIDGLASGTYYVTSHTPSYLDQLYRDVPCPPFSCAMTSGTGVAVTDGGTTSGIDFGLARGGTITGTVTDAGTGSPLADVTVLVYTASGSSTGISVSTDASGVYSATGLATGLYYVHTSRTPSYLDELYRDLPCPAWNCIVTAGTGVAVTAGVTTSDINFSLGPGGTITGTVTDAVSGAPLAGVSVSAVTGSGSSAGSSVTTGASGVYRLTGLATGTYYVRTSNGAPYLDELYHDLPCLGGNCVPTAGTGVEVTAGSTTSGIDFGLVPGGSITGTVTGAGTGEPLANVTLLVYTASGSSAGGSVRTNASGVYTATGLATGTYFVQTSGSIPYLDQLYTDLACPAWNCTVTSGTGVVVTAGTTTNGIDFALAMGGTIAGKVIDVGTGAPLANVTIYVHAASGSFGGQGWTDTLGAYTIAGLATGNYYVETANSPGYVDELYNDLPCAEGSCTRTSGTGVSVVAGTTTSDIDFGLALPPVSPVITWATPAAITQGTALSGTQLNASASVPGSFVYTPPAGTVLAVGMHTLSVVFTPTNPTLYTTTSKPVTLEVTASGSGTFQGPGSGGPATGSVSGSTLTYNGATYPIVGGKVTFPDCTVYIAMTSGMLIPAGTAAGCTPGGGGGGSPVSPVIGWATPAGITQGTALSGTQLNASASVPGSFVYTPPAGTVLAAGTHTLSVTFTPVDTARYTTASRTVTLEVTASGSGGGTFQGPGSGGPATGSVSGSTLTYNGATYPIVGGKVTFPDCTVYIAMTSGLLIPAGTAAGCTPGGGGGGSPVTPVITWATPAAVTQGTALSGTQLNASASVPGSFVYTPPAGTVLAVGTHTLSVTFTPADTTRYTAASRTVTLEVTASGSSGGAFQGPSSGGPATGSVSGSTLTYNGATYPIVGGKVTFPDCTVYIAMTSGLLIPAGTSAGCTPVGGGGGSPVAPTLTWATPAAVTQGTALSGYAAECERQRAG